MKTPLLNIEEQLRNMKLMMIGLTAKEALWRESWNLDRKEILAEFDRINEVVGINDTYGNGMAAIHLKKLYGCVWRRRQRPLACFRPGCEHARWCRPSSCRP